MTDTTDEIRERAVLALAEEYGGSPDDDGERRGRYAVVTSEATSESAPGVDVRITTWATLRQACEHIADEVGEVREFLDGVHDLETDQIIRVEVQIEAIPVLPVVDVRAAMHAAEVIQTHGICPKGAAEAIDLLVTYYDSTGGGI